MTISPVMPLSRNLPHELLFSNAYWIFFFVCKEKRRFAVTICEKNSSSFRNYPEKSLFAVHSYVTKSRFMRKNRPFHESRGNIKNKVFHGYITENMPAIPSCSFSVLYRSLILSPRKINNCSLYCVLTLTARLKHEMTL